MTTGHTDLAAILVRVRGDRCAAAYLVFAMICGADLWLLASLVSQDVGQQQRRQAETACRHWGVDNRECGRLVASALFGARLYPCWWRSGHAVSRALAAEAEAAARAPVAAAEAAGSAASIPRAPPV